MVFRPCAACLALLWQAVATLDGDNLLRVRAQVCILVVLEDVCEKGGDVEYVDEPVTHQFGGGATSVCLPKKIDGFVVSGRVDLTNEVPV